MEVWHDEEYRDLTPLPKGVHFRRAITRGHRRAAINTAGVRIANAAQKNSTISTAFSRFVGCRLVTLPSTSCATKNVPTTCANATTR